MAIEREDYYWATPEARAPHPEGQPVVPAGAWEYAALCERGTERRLGEAWFVVHDEVLQVLARLEPSLGGASEGAIKWWVLVELLGAEGLTAGYYRDRTVGIVLRDLASGARWVCSWRETER